MWREWWSCSTFVADRGHDNITRGLREAIRGKDEEAERRSYETRIRGWQGMVEDGAGALFDPDQMKSLEEIVAYFQGRGYRTRVTSSPRMPGTLSQKAKETTLRIFSERMGAWAADRGMRFVDLTLDHPLTDADFEVDFDHITRDGNLKLAQWALDGPLSFLADSPGAQAQGAPGGDR